MGNHAPLLILLTPFAIIGFIIWGMFMGAPIFPEERVITISDAQYHSHVTSTSWSNPDRVTGRYIEIRIVATDGSNYEYGLTKNLGSGVDIDNGWNLSGSKIIKPGGKYKIQIWHSAFGGYVSDSFSNWNPNPEIYDITRID